MLSRVISAAAELTALAILIALTVVIAASDGIPHDALATRIVASLKPTRGRTRAAALRPEHARLAGAGAAREARSGGREGGIAALRRGARSRGEAREHRRLYLAALGVRRGHAARSARAAREVARRRPRASDPLSLERRHAQRRRPRRHALHRLRSRLRGRAEHRLRGAEAAAGHGDRGAPRRRRPRHDAGGHGPDVPRRRSSVQPSGWRRVESAHGLGADARRSRDRTARGRDSRRADRRIRVRRARHPLGAFQRVCRRGHVRFGGDG